jgi:hypothetical protein
VSTSNLLADFPQRLVLAISLPRDVQSFRDLDDLAKGLNEVDRILNKRTRHFWTAPLGRRGPRAFLSHFQLESPPNFEVWTDPAWLILFLTILVSYKPAKENIREMISDASGILSSIEGLTEANIQTLKIGMHLMLDQLPEGGENASLKMAERLHRARARLLGKSDGPVKISIKSAGKSSKN